MKRLFYIFFCVFFFFGCRTSASLVKKEKAKSYVEEGTALLKKGDTVEAIKVFQGAMLQKPKDPRPAYILGQLFMQFARYHDASRYFQKAITIEPENGEAYLLLGGCFDLEGRKTEAILSVRKSAQIFKKKNDKENLKESLMVLRQLLASARTP